MSKPELSQTQSRKFSIFINPSQPELGETQALIVLDEHQTNHIMECVASFIEGYMNVIDNGKPWVLVAILTGGIYFGVKLSELLGKNGKDHHFETIKYKSYKGQTKQKEPEISPFDFEKYHNFNVMLVDELYDSGDTITQLYKLFKTKLSEDSLIETYVLFRKKLRNKLTHAIEPSRVGIYLPDLWYIGCGLDHCGTKRYLPFLAAIPKDTEDKKICEDEIFNDDEYFKAVCSKIKNNEYAQ